MEEGLLSMRICVLGVRLFRCLTCSPLDQTGTVTKVKGIYKWPSYALGDSITFMALPVINHGLVLLLYN